MLSLTAVTAACLFVTICNAQYEVKPPIITRMKPQGLSKAYPDEPGINLFAVHYSINKPVTGTDAGDYNDDVTEVTGDMWLHENFDVLVEDTDIVYYWCQVQVNGIGYNLIEQTWTPADENTEPTTTTTAGPTTTTTTTTAGPTTTKTTTTRDPTAATTSAPAPCNQVVCDTYPCLIFEDNFDTLNLDNWQHEITAGGGGNWEFEYYTNNRSNSYTKGGVLYIKPTLTADKYGEAFLTSGTLDLWGSTVASECTGNSYYGCLRAGNDVNYINPIQSARLRSTHSFATAYGKIEVSAKLPKGDWIWPAIWMMAKHEGYGAWPASGEIDIMESRGNANLNDEGGAHKGHNSAGSTMHWGPFWPYNGYQKTTKEDANTFADAFHKWTVDWTTNQISFSIDDVNIMTVDPGTNFWDYGEFGLPYESNPWQHSPNKMAPFDQEFHFILNVAVGGTNGFFPDTWTNQPYPKPWLNTSPQAFKDFYLQKDNWYPTWVGEEAALKIDYIRVWKMEA